MIRTARLLVVLTRPALVVLVGLFAALGLAEAGQVGNAVLLAKVLVVVLALLLFSVVVNDLADQAIDAVNLPFDNRRLLVAGAASRVQFVVIAATAAVVAIAGAALLTWPALVVVTAGLAFSAAYSLRPTRLCERGVLASLLLPAGYVAVPFLLGAFARGGTVSRPELVVLVGLYVGFIGRIVLKDFRDVRGDALFGKRTFLVRHGRRRTCVFSAAFWTAGTVALATTSGVTPPLLGAYVAYLALVLYLLRALSTDGGAPRDEALISAIAIVGRGTVVTLLAQLGMTAAHWQPPAAMAVTAALAATMLGQANTMARHGPTTRLKLPTDFGDDVGDFSGATPEPSRLGQFS
jgi:4-hydroxybenzoate polyprenyltransferase